MEADHGSHEESWADHRLQGLQGQIQNHRIKPNIFLWMAHGDMAALDEGIELEAVAKKVIGSTEVQNKARVGRNEYRKVLGTELIRELILK